MTNQFPSWQQPTAPQPDTKRSALKAIVLGVIAVALLCCGGGVAINAFTNDDKPAPTATTEPDRQLAAVPTGEPVEPTATVEPAATTEPVVDPTVTTTRAAVATTPATAKPKPSTTRPKAKPTTTAPKPKPTTKKPKPKPTSEPANTGVHPGAFCSEHGELGTTSKGTLMRCTTTAKDDRYRWRKA